jgi:hypothetical protein
MEQPLSKTAAVGRVKMQFPSGSKLRHKPSGRFYMIGEKSGGSNFWMLDCSESKKGLLPAVQIVKEFEIAG